MKVNLFITAQSDDRKYYCGCAKYLEGTCGIMYRSI